MKINGINFHNLEIEIEGDVSPDDLNMGGLYIKANGKNIILDTTRGYADSPEMTGTGCTRITVDLYRDDEVFDGALQNLTADELLSIDHYDDSKVELYTEEKIEGLVSIILHFDVDGEDYQLEVEEF